jgi:hypothetical protein
LDRGLFVRSFGLEAELNASLRRAFTSAGCALFVASALLSELLRFRFDELLRVISSGSTVILCGAWSGMRTEENASSNRGRHASVMT